MSFITYLLYLAIGVLPCILWLLFYLRQDVHPESNKKVIEIFLLGAIMVVPAVFLEKSLEIFFPEENILLENLSLLLLYYIIVIGLVEEFLKYLPVKLRVINSSHFDEPIDAMLYLIIAGLGFAMIENIIVVFHSETLGEATVISLIRLLTAVFLHTLTAAIIGFFLALSLYQKKEKRRLIVISGLLLAAIFHGLYNVSMIRLEEAQNIFSFLLPIVIIFLIAILVYLFFLKVKKLPRSCKL